MPIDPNIHPHWAAETKELAMRLNELDYFQILGCDTSASFVDIKERYHALQREYHPDTFFQSPDDELQRAVFTIAKRVAEAYVILRDAEKRDKYTREIEGPDRLMKLRFTDETEIEQRREKQKAAEEVYGKTTQGRQLVKKALASLKNGDLKGAQHDLKTALLFEAGNDSIKNRLAEVEEQLKPANQRK